MMCSYQTLCYNEQHGYIIYCTQCRQLQLGFGSVLINFDEQEFYSFKRIVTEIHEDFAGEMQTRRKQITLPTPCATISLYLSIAEINILHSMTDDADTALQANMMIEMFSRE